MNKVYVIRARNQYSETWVARIYTSLDKAKEYLLANYKYWWKNSDIDEEEFNESIEDIQSLDESDISDQDFWVELDRRGIILKLSVEFLDEPIEII